MNTQVSYFKKALVVLMAVIMVFTYMPSMAWAPDRRRSEGDPKAGPREIFYMAVELRKHRKAV